MVKNISTRIDDDGHLILPPEVAQRLGLTPGSEVNIAAYEHQLSISRPLTSLSRVYVEITNQCNLNCATCMRNVWQVVPGQMSLKTFGQILEGIEAFSPRPEIFLGGYGEPISNPDCLAMIDLAKARGLRVSLITNGILLTEAISKALIELQLDMLWVSLDGASPECYSDVRLGNALPQIIANLKMLRAARLWRFGSSPWAGSPRLGIAFVAMKRNIHDLAEVISLGTKLGAVEFSITNVLAHNPTLQNERLYRRAMNQVASRHSQQWKPLIHIPRMDIENGTAEAFIALLKSTDQLDLFGSLLDQNVDRCPFVERGSLAIRWDGKVSPCLPLLYTHAYYLGERQRCSQAYFVGDLAKDHLSEIWADPAYVSLRDRLQRFDFSPCTYCNSCEMANDNLEDCYGNTLPACGGCLWAQGLIRCP
ncbi:MAG: radical SAM protein [Anaerolineales bacterium]|nr:radical SAM protein [Anaerolineales bacterium]